ncbi:hypothetical protein PJN26_29595, partial [Mycobacterium kansasii]
PSVAASKNQAISSLLDQVLGASSWSLELLKTGTLFEKLIFQFLISVFSELRAIIRTSSTVGSICILDML